MSQTTDDEMIQIPRHVAEELAIELYSLIYRYKTNFNGPDYRACEFCRQESRVDDSDIKHDSDCLGLRLQKVLQDQEIF